MIDIELLRQYQEWRAGNEGKKVDVSPEAFALHNAIDALVANWLSDANSSDSHPLVDRLASAWKALNAPTD